MSKLIISSEFSASLQSQFPFYFIYLRVRNSLFCLFPGDCDVSPRSQLRVQHVLRWPVAAVGRDHGLWGTVTGASELGELDCCTGMRAACLSHSLSVVKSSFVGQVRPVSWSPGPLAASGGGVITGGGLSVCPGRCPGAGAGSATDQLAVTSGVLLHFSVPQCVRVSRVACDLGGGWNY